ncbi:hypothetical protein ABZ234_07810 [Nocardiopsis sp. NPDC006198]|uniref:hypothetical protein n=1 Tax=Nocardiopsis sp. NPDC006198 TaxID=3154472 RepID=UPI0033A86F13
MLAFLLGSTMFLVMLASLAVMVALGRSRKYGKYTAWGVFLFALMAGSAAALCFVGEGITWVLTFLCAVVGLPVAAIGIIAMFGVLGTIIDLADGQPDGLAKTMALIVPVLLAVTGGDLGLYGTQATNGLSGAGAVLFGNLIGV